MQSTHVTYKTRKQTVADVILHIGDRHRFLCFYCRHTLWHVLFGLLYRQLHHVILARMDHNLAFNPIATEWQ